jgi:release factor glutamine methyltransferase
MEENKNFEESLQELECIVKELESGNVNLDDAINKYTHDTEAEIKFLQADYLNTNLTEKYDVIISNPPYIGSDENIEIEDSVKGFEPNIALFSPTSDALIFYRKIAKDCENHLNENGLFFLEINQKLGKETLELFSNYSESRLIKDLSGNDRFVMGRK